jgi:7,8-dihydropterin-6-yl-methyl-4-(beta-D-ribofuranosyl)aminobenzene 5'-phosphate synthase
VDKNTEIVPNIHLVTLVSDKLGTLELRELSLVINTSEGLVIVVGCSHPGIDKIVEAATAINPAFTSSLAAFILLSHPIPISRGSSPRCMIGSKSNTLPPVTAPESQRSQP